MSESSKQRRDARWAERYQKSQAAFDARDRDQEKAGGWAERVSGEDGTSYQLEVIPPGEPVGRDGWFYVRFALSFFVRGWMPTASNEEWVVEVRSDRAPKTISRTRFDNYLAALEYVRQSKVRIRAGSESPIGLKPS